MVVGVVVAVVVGEAVVVVVAFAIKVSLESIGFRQMGLLTVRILNGQCNRDTGE